MTESSSSMKNTSEKRIVNQGPGAGAINEGKNAGSRIKNHEGINKPLTGYINKGPGAGAINGGDKAGCIIQEKEITEKDIKEGKIKAERSIIGDKNEINFRLSDNDPRWSYGNDKVGNYNIAVGANSGNGPATTPLTGNFNKGPAAGAINQGKRAGCIIGHTEGINFISNDSTVRIPPHGSINKGPGAGGYNSGEKSASIINCKEPKWS